MDVQVLPVVLNIRLYSARLEFFRSLAQAVQAPEVEALLPTSHLCTLYQHTTGERRAAVRDTVG